MTGSQGMGSGKRRKIFIAGSPRGPGWRERKGETEGSLEPEGGGDGVEETEGRWQKLRGKSFRGYVVARKGGRGDQTCSPTLLSPSLRSQGKQSWVNAGGDSRERPGSFYQVTPLKRGVFNREVNKKKLRNPLQRRGACCEQSRLFVIPEKEGASRRLRT